MYISDKCVFTPYTSDFLLDEELDNIYDKDKLEDWLIKNNNYGLDEVFRKAIQNKYEYESYNLNAIKSYIINQGYGLDIFINDKNYNVRGAVAKQGYGLDILVNDESEWVRLEVARQGYGLDKLVNDKADNVRKAVADQGYGLDKLINDKDYHVRWAVADQGYGLDKLVNDESEWVRKAIAKQGYGLDILINDIDSSVRAEVARQGYGLDKLINNKDVCTDVLKFLKDKDLTLLKWYNNNPDKCYYNDFHDTLVEYPSNGYIEQLLNDSIYLDWILKNNDDYRSNAREIIIKLGYNNLQDWIKNYPNNVYYKELVSELQKSNNTKPKKKSKKSTELSEEQLKTSESEKVTQDFIVKINDSKTLAINESLIDDFFSSDNIDNTEFVIFTADTKLPIIKINKVVKDDNLLFKFIVDIVTENDDNFSIKSTITTKEQLNKLIEQTIDALKNYPQFAKYIDDLENCLK